MGIYNNQKTESIYGTSKVLMKPGPWLLWVCPVCVHHSWWIFCAFMQGTQLLIVFSMSELMLGQYTMLRAMAFIRLMPGCPLCNCLRTALLSFVGITTRSANIKHSSMMARKSLRRWNCCRSPVRSDGHEHLKNWITFWSPWSCCVSCLISTLVTGIPLTQSVSVRWKSPLMLMAKYWE